jgi:hypothetical protein
MEATQTCPFKLMGQLTFSFFLSIRSFRQKQRFSQLSGKEHAREAVIAMRGFDQVMYCGGKTATGEVDTRHIEKSFVFEGTADELRLHNGSCLVDYKNTDFRSYVFLVHRTRGRLAVCARSVFWSECSNHGPYCLLSTFQSLQVW